jgi:hydroxymethylpyrimidine pyrophosphatase-like HAD family hydrolase
MVSTTFGTRWLLVTDVDGTLTGDGDALGVLVEAVAAAGSVRLVLDSSRPVRSVAGTLARLPVAVRPDAVVGALGTEIEIDGASQEGWRTRFDGWDRRPVDRVMAELGWPAHRDEFQTPLKASFSVPPAARGEAERRVVAAGVDARFIYGDADDFDVIPSSAGKEAPLGWLSERLGVHPANTVAAGDGSNDIGLLRAAPHAVLVGNATDVLRTAVAGSGAYQARACHAGGVLEGLRALRVLAEAPA